MSNSKLYGDEATIRYDDLIKAGLSPITATAILRMLEKIRDLEKRVTALETP